ncbi:hypothetical protein [Saccharopolyspora thermophila]|uniref:Uncharacterized protein n=1 Tax=Saccharopolyspora thermophila TaxID=89367 RepID=A0ABN1D899_9PSEU|nr:hypothetical protein [Saccharopolyspora subtropica]
MGAPVEQVVTSGVFALNPATTVHTGPSAESAHLDEWLARGR